MPLSADCSIIAIIENFSIELKPVSSGGGSGPSEYQRVYVLEALPLGFLDADGNFERGTTPRLTGAPSSTARRACVSSPKQTSTQYASHKTPNSLAGWSRSPQPADAPTPSTCPARPPPWTRRPARSSTTTTPAPNPANASPSAAATDGQPSAPPAPASMRATLSTWSARVCSAARTSPPRSAGGPGSSSP